MKAGAPRQLGCLPCQARRQLVSLSLPCVNVRILIRSNQIRPSIVTTVGSLDTLGPPHLRRAVVHIRGLCPGAPAWARISMVAERLPRCTGVGMPLAFEGTVAVPDEGHTGCHQSSRGCDACAQGRRTKRIPNRRRTTDEAQRTRVSLRVEMACEGRGRRAHARWERLGRHRV
jgi:hypothetical protein